MTDQYFDTFFAELIAIKDGMRRGRGLYSHRQRLKSARYWREKKGVSKFQFSNRMLL